MRIDRPGKWLAVTTAGAIEQKSTGSVQFCGSFVATHELVGGQWVELNPQMDLNGYLNIVKKDGSLNEKSIEKLREAYGWDGADPAWLQDSDLSSIQVQITTDWENDQNGVPKMRVKYLDAAGRESSIKKADEAAKRAIREQFGAKFRALSGGTSAKPPLPPKAAPPPSAPPADVMPYSPATMDETWEAFCRFYKGDDEKKREAEWWKILKQQFGPRLVPQDIQPGEWGKLVAEMQTLVNVPF